MNNLIFNEDITTFRYEDIKVNLNKFKLQYELRNNLKEYIEIGNLLLDDSRKNVNSLGANIFKEIEKLNKENLRVKNLYDFDKNYGYNIVAGVDEVGRGPLAGPIVSAAVILDLNADEQILFIDDSKKLSKALREQLAEEIKEKALAYSIAIIDNNEIDAKGIGYCNHEVFRRAIDQLNIKPDMVLSDGYLIKGFYGINKAVIKGDSKSASIACASILAKVFRDKIMEEYSVEYPQYGFDHNSGYGTKEHINGILNNGSCKLHRQSFLKNINISNNKK